MLLFGRGEPYGFRAPFWVMRRLGEPIAIVWGRGRTQLLCFSIGFCNLREADLGLKLKPPYGDWFRGKAAMSPGSRGRPRQRLGDRGLLKAPSLSKRRLLPRVQLLPLLLLALTMGLAFYIVWNSWHPGVEEVSRSRDLRVSPGWGPAGIISLFPFLLSLRLAWPRRLALAACAISLSIT